MGDKEAAWSMLVMIIIMPLAFMIFLVYGERLFVKYVSRKWSDAIAAVSISLILALIALMPYRPGLQATTSAERVMGMPLFFWLFMGLVLTSGGMFVYAAMFKRKVSWLLATVMCIGGLWYFAWPYLEDLAPPKPSIPIARMVKLAPRQHVTFCVTMEGSFSPGSVYIPDRIALDPELSREAQQRNLVLTWIFTAGEGDCDPGEYEAIFTPRRQR